MAGKSPRAPGYIYIFVNSTNPNEIKIGLSINPIERVKQLYTSGTAKPMYPQYLWEVPNMKEAEDAAHEIMKGHRINQRREFFNLVSEDAALYIETPHPHFGGHELAEVYLQAIRERIENGWECINIDYKLVWA